MKENKLFSIFKEKIKTFRFHLIERGYQENLIQVTLSEVKFDHMKLAVYNNNNFICTQL